MMDLFGGIYNGKKVLITGHTGFKGSWLTLWLKEMGADVVGYSLEAPSTPNHFELLGLDIPTITGDIRDSEKLSQAINEHKPDIVFHLAAQALVRDSYTSPVDTFSTNVMGTVNVLEACRLANIGAVINVTSDKCYHNQEIDRAYTEEDALGGHDPYSASKGCAEIVGNSYRLSFFNPTTYASKHHTLLADVRAGNVIGGGDWAKDRLIPDCMRAAHEGRSVTIRNPNATRPWQHVLEPLSGYLHIGWRLLSKEPDFAHNWNFGPNENASVPVKEILDGLKHHWDAINIVIDQDPNQPHEATLLKLDSTKARTKLNWRPVWDKDQTLNKTAVWYKTYYDSRALLTRDDLQSYIDDAKKLKVGWAL